MTYWAHINNYRHGNSVELEVKADEFNVVGICTSRHYKVVITMFFLLTSCFRWKHVNENMYKKFFLALLLFM
jgi:hypothetical protein